MKPAAGVLALIGACCLAFAYWGLETAGGRATYDEMDGMIPFFAGVGGAALIVVGLVLLLIARLRRA